MKKKTLSLQLNSIEHDILSGFFTDLSKAQTLADTWVTDLYPGYTVASEYEACFNNAKNADMRDPKQASETTVMSR